MERREGDILHPRYTRHYVQSHFRNEKTDAEIRTWLQVPEPAGEPTLTQDGLTTGTAPLPYLLGGNPWAQLA